MKNGPLILMLISLLVCNAQQQKNTFRIGQKSVLFEDASRNRPLATEIWYPTHDDALETKPKENKKELFKTIKTIPNASIPNQKFPLLIVSHGTGGNRFSLTWFIQAMVKEGYMVVSLDHYGNSTFNKIPREFVKWWERAIDVQYVLTQVLEDKDIGFAIDSSKIGGVGFSLGGYTNIALAGDHVDRTVHENEHGTERAMPAEFPETDEVIDFEKDSLIVSSYRKYKDLVKDDRITSFFVMAPAIGFGFHTVDQTKEITAPIFIVAGKGDQVAPVNKNAEKYHSLIKSSKIHLFNENVQHYIFLNEATPFGKQVAPAITIDHPKINRGEIHQKTLVMALEFFKGTL